jgi:hypothetical protein
MCSVLDDESIAVRGEKGENKLAHGDRRIYRGRSQRKYAKGYPSTRSFTDAEVSGTGNARRSYFPLTYLLLQSWHVVEYRDCETRLGNILRKDCRSDSTGTIAKALAWNSREDLRAFISLYSSNDHFEGMSPLTVQALTRCLIGPIPNRR